MRIFLIAIAALVVSGCSAEADSHKNKPMIEHLNTPAMEGRDAPFSSAVRIGNTLYLSGMLGIKDGELVDGGIGPETRATMDSIKATLEMFGSSIEQVAKCTVFLADMAEWPAMNEVYTTYFKNKPARSAIAASGLALDARVEIECIAYVE
jgi:reactive intermediate/imine deaminase